MSRYFIDTEFLEGSQKEPFPISLFRKKTKPTIDLISIALVSEDNREYYAISKDFNLKEAWNRHDIKRTKTENNPYKDYWIRENVLKSIWRELRVKEVEEYNIATYRNVVLDFPTYIFTYESLKRLINKYGKTNKQIVQEIKDFVAEKDRTSTTIFKYKTEYKFKDVQFYGYYADYDWVAFCWLFGKMIDLPNGFPMFAFDLKQTMDEKVMLLMEKENQSRIFHKIKLFSFDEALESFKTRKDYPKQTNEHNALSDSRFVRDLYYFLNNKT